MISLIFVVIVYDRVCFVVVFVEGLFVGVSCVVIDFVCVMEQVDIQVIGVMIGVIDMYQFV